MKRKYSTGNRLIKIFLRLSLGFGFLSAVADRFGLWPEKYTAWGNWDSFLVYTSHLLNFIPDTFIPAIAIIATVLEVLLGIFLILGIRTRTAALYSGILLLLFAAAMAYADSVKRPLDASVFTAAAAAFALTSFGGNFLEIDALGKK